MYIDHIYSQLNCSLRRFVSSQSTSFHLKGEICEKTNVCGPLFEFRVANSYIEHL